MFASVKVDVDRALSWKSAVENILGSEHKSIIYCHVWPRGKKKKYLNVDENHYRKSPMFS